MLLTVFSTTVNAEEVEVKPYSILQQNQLETDLGITTISTKTFTPFNGTQDKWENTIQYDYYYLTKRAHYRSIYVLAYHDNEIILKPNKTYSVSLRNIYYSSLIQIPNGQMIYCRNPKYFEFKLGYADGTGETINNYTIENVSGTPYVNVIFDVTPEKEVIFISYTLTNSIHRILESYEFEPFGTANLTAYSGEHFDDMSYSFFLDVQTVEEGLLSSIVDWLKGIKSKIDDTFSSVTNGFTSITSWLSNVVNNIIELPSKLWILISDGLMSLFVPNEQKLAEYKEDWDLLLSQRFGALYEVGDVFNEIVDNNILNQSSAVAESGIIEIPRVSLQNYGIPFEFGGYLVDIKPEGFDWLIVICKRVISISCTLLFINVLRKKYDLVIGG